MNRTKLELADVFRRYGQTYREKFGAFLSTAQRRVMRAIEVCRIAALSGHVEVCDHCGHQRLWYNSCSNRHCPQCQSLARAEWIQDRQAELLDTPLCVVPRYVVSKSEDMTLSFLLGFVIGLNLRSEPRTSRSRVRRTVGNVALITRVV